MNIWQLPDLRTLCERVRENIFIACPRVVRRIFANSRTGCYICHNKEQ